MQENYDHAILAYIAFVILLLALVAIWSDVRKTRDEQKRQAVWLKRIHTHVTEDPIERAILGQLDDMVPGEIRTGVVTATAQGVVAETTSSTKPTGYDRGGRPTYDDQLEDVRRFEQPQLFDQEAQPPLAEVHDLSSRRPKPTEFGPA